MLKEKIKNGEKIIGTHLNMNDVASARISGLAGFDYIWVDLEHTYLSLESLMSAIIAIKTTGTAVIVRVPQDDLTYTKKVLEMGPDGIIFPMIRSAKQANERIASTLYPPYGNRGFGPMNAIDFGFSDVEFYVRNTKDNLLRFIQIEHTDAIAELDEIMKNEYIDGYIFGPMDLSGSINELCNIFGENTTHLIEDTVSRLKANGKYVGISIGDTAVSTLEHWSNMGIDMISAGVDVGYIQQEALNTRRKLERACNTSSLYKNKTFFTKENLTPDVNCSMLPPNIFGAEASEADCYNTKNRRWQSAPSTCRASDGSLLCAFSGDNFGGDEAPNNYNVIMRSRDNGNSWQTVCILDHIDSVRMHEPIMWCDNAGTVWHFWAQSYNWWDGRGGVWAIKLDIDGDCIKWSAPKRLCSGVMATPPITLADGKVMLPVSIWQRWKGQIHDYPNWGDSSVYITESPDKPLTRVGGTFDERSTFDENAIVQRSDGSIYMIIRCDNYIAYTESFNFGRDWSKPQKLMDHCSSRSYMARFPSGNYLLVTNNDTNIRSNMTAFISTDECRTWQPKLLLDERAWTSYPAGHIDESGRAFVTYDFNRVDDKEIFLASFTEEDMMNGSITDKNSFIKKLVVKGEGSKNSDNFFVSGD